MGSTDTIINFEATILVMIFYSFAITGLSYAMPADTSHYPEIFSSGVSKYDVNNISQTTKSSLSSQTNVPLIDLGALVFYSGNLFIDLILNFITAIPQMITILFTGILMLINVDTIIANWIQIFLTGAYAIYATLNIITFAVGQRSKGIV